MGSALSAALFLLLPDEVKPDIEVLPSAEINIGQVKQGTITNLRFDLTNTSSNPLEIVDVATTCGCTTANLSRKKIGLGDSFTVDLSYDSGQSRGDVHAHAKLLYFESNAEERRYKTLTLAARGKIDPDFDLIPERLYFKKDLLASSQLLRVIPRHAANFTVERVVCDKRFFTATIVGRTPSRRPRGYEATSQPSQKVSEPLENKRYLDRTTPFEKLNA